MNSEEKNYMDHFDLSKLPASKPGKIEELENLERSLNLKVADVFSRVYMILNGFYNYHFGSQVILWDLDKIVQANKGLDTSNSDRSMRIGDILMESDYIMMNISDNKSNIKLLYEDRIMSLSLVSFLDDMSNGKFDFL